MVPWCGARESAIRDKATLCRGEGGLKLQNIRSVGRQKTRRVVTEIYGREKKIMSEIVRRCVRGTNDHDNDIKEEKKHTQGGDEIRPAQ